MILFLFQKVNARGCLAENQGAADCHDDKVDDDVADPCDEQIARFFK